MINLIIVDDEKYTCLMLSDIMDWQSMGFNLCGVFYNGSSALEYIKNNHVDMVITDINMPKMSGIELATELNSSFPEIYIVFISAYRDFEYARAALSLQVKDYIIKPIVYEQLENTINTAKKFFDKKNVNNKFINDEISLMRKQFFCDCLSGILSEDDISQDTLNSILIKRESLFNPSGLIELIISDFTKNLIEKWKYEPEQIYSAIQNMLPSETDNFYLSPVTYSYNRMEFILLSKNNIPEFSKKIEQFISDEEAELSSYLETNVEIHIVKTADSLFNLHYPNNSDRITDNIVRNIISHMVENNQQKTYNALNSAFEVFDHESLNNLLIRLFEEFSEFNIDITPPPINDSAENQASWAKSCIDTYLSQTHTGYNEIINKALNFIDNHYNEFITLENVSAHVSMNPGYFSTYFKNQTGEKFIDYLVRLRIEKAMSLIDNNPSIKSVVLCDSVGYKSIPYFYKIFRSFTGMTPSEYKEKILKERKTND